MDKELEDRSFGAGRAGKTTQQIEAEELTRREKAMSMRIAGATVYQIGEQLNISPSGVSHLIRRELKRREDALSESSQQLRQISHARLETVIRRCWLKAYPADPTAPLDYDAVDRIIRAVREDARIMGYSMPAKHQVDITHLQSQMGLVLEVIARAVPDDCMPKVYEALDEAIGTLQHREAALEYSGP